MSATEFVINTRKLKYTGGALAAFRTGDVKSSLRTHDKCDDHITFTEIIIDDEEAHEAPLDRIWLNGNNNTRRPQPAKGRHIGTYALTSRLSSWVKKALESYQPNPEVLELVRPFATEFHEMIETERKSSAGLHDIDAIEMTYQCTLELSTTILLAADTTDDPVDLALQLHASRAGGDDHFLPWGRLLTNLECDPPIIVQFPFYLLMCQSFTFEPNWHKEDYVYSALTGVDFAKGNNKFNDRLAAFETLAQSSVPTLDDAKSGEDRCFWRIALAYLKAMNNTENARVFRTPRAAHISHNLHPDLVIIARAFDTIGSAYMCRDGAAWLDDEGIDSLIGSALPNDVMDLHTDVFTGETRNLLRLLYPAGLSIEKAMQTTSTLLSGMLCEIFRGHHRAFTQNREDARISSTSPPYSFCRARHRRIFETLELYINKYPEFWDWTWQIYQQAKDQITSAGMAEPLVCSLKRAINQGSLPEAPANGFFKLWYEMVEPGPAQVAQLSKKSPLGVDADLVPIIRNIHSLWHGQFMDTAKTPGWGKEFDYKSDALIGEAGEILHQKREGITDEAYKFTVAYGRLSMSLPYVAYHTVDAIIMAFGAIGPV